MRERGAMVAMRRIDSKILIVTKIMPVELLSRVTAVVDEVKRFVSINRTGSVLKV